MIWITTLCLLAVALWLFFNALNERRWVEAHSHDETVASDEGLLPSLTALTGTAATAGGTPADGQETAMTRAAAKLQEGSGKLGEQLKTAKQSAAQMYEKAKEPNGVLGEDSPVGRAAGKAREQASKLNQKLDEKMKSASSLTTGSGENGDQSFLQKAAATSGDLTHKVAKKVADSADGLTGKTNAAGDESIISKVAGKVSSGMHAVEHKMEKVAANRNSQASTDNLVNEASAKVSSEVNAAVNDKVVDTTKQS